MIMLLQINVQNQSISQSINQSMKSTAISEVA